MSNRVSPLKPPASLSKRMGDYSIATVQLLRRITYRLFSAGMRTTGRANDRQPILCLGHGSIQFAGNNTFGYLPAADYLTGYCLLNPRAPTASISFGRDTFINNGFTAIAERGRIAIGDRVQIGTHVSIYDSDFHGLTPESRNDPDAVQCADVVIGNDVFIGSEVVILKGVTIGDGAVIGARSLVTRSIPAFTVAAGSPAITGRRLNSPP